MPQNVSIPVFDMTIYSVSLKTVTVLYHYLHDSMNIEQVWSSSGKDSKFMMQDSVRDSLEIHTVTLRHIPMID
jgi:hypothetical protein